MFSPSSILGNKAFQNHSWSCFCYMGKRLAVAARFITTSGRPTNQIKPVASSSPQTHLPKLTGSPKAEPLEQHYQQRRRKKKSKNMEVGNSNPSSTAEPPRRRFPLSEVVADCAKRWFQDALKEAKSGDTAMQVLVGQMYSSGYGVARDVQKGNAWINRASRSRSSAWKVGDKHPGYNASDSDSDDGK